MRGLCLLLLSACLPAADFDLLIRNARVVDGAGVPWFYADVGVKDGRIARIGRGLTGDASRTIEARSRVLAPGFIDVHTHTEGNLERDPTARNFLRGGVTTIITGNCGYSFLDLPSWFARLRRKALGVNVGTLAGHNALRSGVVGAARREASPAELERMKQLLETAMRNGAFGLSTGLEYVPGAYAPQSEIAELAKVAARFDGVYATHMRDEGEKVLEALEEALAIGREAGIRVQISHLKQDTRRVWGLAPQMLAKLDAARAEGLDVVADQYPYTRSATGLSIRLPAWALADGQKAIRLRLSTPATRAKIAAEMVEMLRRRGYEDYSYATVVNFAHNRRYEGKTIPEVARMKGLDPTLDNQVRTILDLMAAGGAGMVYQVMSEDDVETIMKWPHAAIASDGGIRRPGDSPTHPRSYGTNARVLGEYVRQRGVLTLEEAVRRMTSLPARTFNLRDRGLVREGFAADLVLFDPDMIEDRATYTDGHQYPAGIDAVIVNGHVTIDEGELTAARGGAVLRHTPAETSARFDLLIRGARLLDGAGNAWRRGSVGITDGRIAAVGALPGASATRVIEAADAYLAPGFIDVHTHVEDGLPRHPEAQNFLRDGVTTIVTGNCGSSELDLDAWFAGLAAKGLGLNVASLVGHNSVRRAVMGTAQRDAAPDELERMRGLVRRAMQQGAFGLSTGLEYVPGAYAPLEEVAALAAEAAGAGGLYATHMRDEGEKVLEALNEAVEVARRAACPLQVSHLKQDTRRLWGTAPQMLAVLDGARRAGIDAVADQYPYNAYSTSLSFLLPSWALADGAERVRARLSDPATRARIKAETVATVRAKGNTDLGWVRLAGAHARPGDAGKTIAAISGSSELEQQVETLLNIVQEGGGSGVYTAMSEADIDTILRSPLTAVASDGGAVTFGDGRPHPRSYGTNARVLSQYTRQRGLLSLEEAVRRMTALPARTFGLRDRGLLVPGAAADLVLFRPEQVRDEATFDDPHRYSSGFDIVIVNGQVALDAGTLTPARAGRTLRR